MKNFKNIDTYVASFPAEVQTLLQKMRATIQKASPKATEAMKYGIPTFLLNGKNLVHFGGFKKHIGFFPTPSAITVFKKDLSKYVCSKGTVQFQLNESVPWGLITKMVKFRVSEINSLLKQ